MSLIRDYEKNWESQFARVEYVIGVPVELINEIFPIIGSEFHTTDQVGGYIIYTFTLPAAATHPHVTLSNKFVPVVSFNKTHYDIYDVLSSHFSDDLGWVNSTDYGVSGNVVRAFTEVTRNKLFNPSTQANQYFKFKTLQLLKVKPDE